MDESTAAPAIARTIREARHALGAARRRGARVALVPTMGALHAGHRSLLEAARSRCEFVVASIFVNPTQFAPHEDFGNYPRPLDADLAVCREEGVDLVFLPQPEEIYPADFSTSVEVAGISDGLEGASRPGHFRGVATIVLKLLQIVRPDEMLLGRKDYQQQLLLRRMCSDLNVPVEIVTCPTVRDDDGLALSSRNVRLNEEERRTALALPATLEAARDRLLAGERNITDVRREMRSRLEATPGMQLDYATIADADTLAELDAPRPRMVALIAARVGSVRLIDNMPIEPREP